MAMRVFGRYIGVPSSTRPVDLVCKDQAVCKQDTDPMSSLMQLNVIETLGFCVTATGTETFTAGCFHG
jgi:hypothetical protein